MALSWQPRWTKQVRIESGGRYPLGLNRFHDGIEEILIKGIVGAANRLRYVSYCCWIIGDIEMTTECDDYAEFVDAFTRRENALALGLYLTEPNYSIYGSEAISKVVSKDIKNYDCTFRLMQSRDLGAYGLYYAGTIYNWGLTETDKNGLIRLTQAGKEIYGIMDAYYKKVKPEYFIKYKRAKQIPEKVLRHWAKINDFNNIRQPEHKKERDFYKTVLFRLKKRKVSDYRRDTFAFVIECINECSKTNSTFNEDVLRNIHYYSSYYNTTGTVQNFIHPKHFDDVQFYWALYEGHVYFRGWLSRYFEVFLDHLKSHDHGSTIDEFFFEIDSETFDNTINHFCKTQSEFYQKPMEDIIDLVSHVTESNKNMLEVSVTNDKEYESHSEVMGKFVLIMIGLYTKFKNLRSDRRYQYIAHNLIDDLWAEKIFYFRKLKKMSVNEFLKEMLKKYIINQHDFIMMEKNDLRRCWFTTENRRYYHQADVSLFWRPPKFQTIMNFLTDMNLIDNEDGIIRVSKEGKDFYQKFIEDYY